MTGLADAYSDDVGALQSSSRLRAGVGLLALGTLLALAALVVALANPTEWGARRLSGVLAGLAAPALAGGVVVILPASRRLRAAAAIGASLTVLGVATFWYAYPSHWLGHGRELTPYVTGVYFLGMLTVLVCLFAGIATFKRRNDPGGTVSMMVGQAETKIVRVQDDSGGGSLGGVGLLGSTPEGDVETQTNRPDRSGGSSAGRGGSSAGRGDSAGGSGSSSVGSGRSASGSDTVAGDSAAGSRSTRSSSAGTSSTSRTSNTSRSSNGGAFGSPGSAVSDGGAEAETLQSPEPKADRQSPSESVADRYCGNCEHFQYVRTEQGMTPYCGLDSEYMEDMEACDSWSPNA